MIWADSFSKSKNDFYCFQYEDALSFQLKFKVYIPKIQNGLYLEYNKCYFNSACTKFLYFILFINFF